MSEQLDLEALRRLHRREYRLPPDFERRTFVTVPGATWDLVLVALERADEIADQGCEFCEATVTDHGEDGMGRREPYGHWWACGKCWNESAAQTSMATGHLSDLLGAALDEREALRRENYEVHDKLVDTAERLERLEAALREHWLANVECDHEARQDKPWCACSRVDLGWHSNVGAAVEAWIQHVLSIAALAGAPATGLKVNAGPLQIVKSWRCPGCGRTIGGLRVHADGCSRIGEPPPAEEGP